MDQIKTKQSKHRYIKGLDRSHWTIYKTNNSGLPWNDVNALSIDENETIWIGTYVLGLAKFDGINWTTYNNSNSNLPENTVHEITIDNVGSKWIGTWGGLSIFNESGIPIEIFIQPENQEVCPHTNSCFYCCVFNANEFQWQVNTGNGFINVYDNNIYSGAQTDSLQIIEAPVEMSGFQYQCLISNQYDTVFSDIATLFVEDTTLPEIICVTDQIRNLPEGVFLYTVQGTEFDPILTLDNCSIESIFNNFNNLATLEGAEFPSDTTLVIWTIVDSSGNFSECSFNVTVNSFVRIFPNPVNDYLNIDLPLHCSNNYIEIENVYGTFIENYRIVNNQNTLDVRNLPKGIYIVKIDTKNGVAIKKLIKQ